MMRVFDERIPRQYLVFDEVDKVRHSSYFLELASKDESDDREHDISTVIEESLVTGRIDADAIIDALFPQKYAEVFISHSHSEVNTARALKAKIEHELGLSCFIDGDVWGNVYDKLEEFQRKWGLHECDNSLNRCNFAASHFYLMLSSALMQMMGQAHAILFIKPETAIQTGENGAYYSTESAWIRQELLVAKQLMPIDIIKLSFWNGPMMAVASTQTPSFFYNVDIKGFYRISFDELSLIQKKMTKEYWMEYRRKRMEGINQYLSQKN